MDDGPPIAFAGVRARGRPDPTELDDPWQVGSNGFWVAALVDACEATMQLPTTAPRPFCICSATSELLTPLRILNRSHDS